MSFLFRVIALKGRQMLSGDFNPRFIPRSIRLKSIPLVILNTCIIEESLVFLAPFRAVVVLGLVADVLRGLVKVPVINGEGTVARLPSEALVVAFVQGLDPLAAVGFDILDELGQGDGLGQGGQDVDVVADTANGYRDAVHVVDDAADVGKDLVEVLVAYLHTMALDVEDEVDVVFYE